MIYIKCVLAGLVAAIAAAIIWLVGVIVVPLAAARAVGWLFGAGGGVGAFVTSDQLLIVAFVGFVFGFTWAFRRARRRAS